MKIPFWAIKKAAAGSGAFLNEYLMAVVHQVPYS